MQDGSEWRRDGEDSGVVPVRPVVQGKGLPTLPRTLVVALIVGLLTFVAGIQLGSGRTAPTVTPIPSAIAATSPDPDVSPTPFLSSSDPSPQIPVTPGTSELSRSFKPQDAITSVHAGAKCVTHDQSTADLDAESGEPVFIHIWSSYCPVKAAQRGVFASQVMDAIATAMVASSWSATTDDAGATVALYPYHEGPYRGTVTLSADAAGAGTEIVITLQERILQ